MPRAQIGGELNINSRAAKKSLQNFERDAREHAARLGRIPAPSFAEKSAAGFRRGGEEAQRWSEKARHGYATTAAAGAGLVLSLKAIDRAVLGSLATFDDMVDKLAALGVGSDAAREQVRYLQSVATDQNMEMGPLVLAHERLLTLGYDAQRSLEFVRELANALEFSSGEEGDLLRVVESLDKMGQKADVSTKALTALGEKMPLLRDVMAGEFGGGTAAELDALGLSAEELFAGIERGLKRLPTVKVGLGAERGILGSGATVMKGMIGAGAAMLGTDAGAWDTGVVLKKRVPAAAESDEDRARRLAAMRAAAEAKRLEAARAEIDAAQEIARTESALRMAREDGNEKEIARLEDKLDLLREAAALAEKYNVSMEHAASLIKESNAERRKLEAVEKGRGQGKELSAARQQMAVETLRARGKNKAADKLEKAASLRDETARFEKMGLPPAEARRMAEQGQRNKEDADYFAKTGQRKKRGAVSRNLDGGIDGEFHSAAVDFTDFTGVSGKKGKNPQAHSLIPGFDVAVRGTPRTDAGNRYAAEKRRMERGVEQLKRQTGRGAESTSELNTLKEIKAELSRLTGIMLKDGGARASR